jgi:class 3 adenylate cyclase/predicted ATPase
MENLSAWLERLGLERYESVFAANDVDFDVLLMLSEKDLQDLGLSLGHRKKLLKALSELDAPAASGGQASVAPPLPTRTVASPPQGGANGVERRKITVMFCDLAGSTALSQRLDPEDLREVMRRYQETARSVVERYNGHIAQYLGDGLLVYFGWPQMRGAEAERAIRSGLEIAESVRHLDTLAALSVRVGVATGLVVVGKAVDGDVAEPDVAVGETPNLAARLQALASPDTIVVCPLTRDLAGDAFDYADLGRQELKGISEPIRLWRIEGVRTEDGDDGQLRGAPPLVGRDEEIGLLRRAWQQTKESHGQVVLISGEPGIGKSALVETLVAQLRQESVPRIFIRCSAYHMSSALYPVIEHIKKVIGWRPDAQPAENTERLERTLEAYALPLGEFVPPLASMLSLPLPEGRYQGAAVPPSELKQRTLDCLTEWQLVEAERQPTTMIWEDLHWADPSTLEFLSGLIEQARTSPLLLVLTFRPDFVPPHLNQSHLTPIHLNRLERPQIELLVRQLAGGKLLPAEVLEHIVRKTDGVPLYVEELTKTILGSSILKEVGDRFEQTGPLSAVSIPATLYESLMARLDRLPTAREVAQLGAVLGREFAYEMLRELSRGDESLLRDGLSQLVADELLYQRGRPPRAKYVFKHALIQDAAYQSLLKRTRRQYHKEVAQLIEGRFPEQAVMEPELLAYHYMGAEMPREAIAYWIKAARRSASRSAYREALGQLDSGHALLQALPDDRERMQLELQLQVERAFALVATQGMAAEKTTETFSAAHGLCRKLGDESKEAYSRVSWALAASTITRSQWPQALAITEELLDKAQRDEDVPSMMGAHRLLGFALFFSGDYRRGRSHMEQSVALYDFEKHHKLAAVYGQDPGVGSLAILSWILLPLGLPDQALAQAQKAVQLSRKLGHSHSLAYALHYASVVHLERGEYEEAQRQAQAAIALATEYGFPVWLSLSRIIRGEARAALGEGDEGIDDIRQGIRAFEATGTQMSRPYNYLALSRALRHADRLDEALEAINMALALVAQYGERRQEADMLRAKSELALSSPALDRDEGHALLRRAIEAAREQGTLMWELRATAALARVLRSAGSLDESQALLAPVYGAFGEGFATRDLALARALLDEVDVPARSD